MAMFALMVFRMGALENDRKLAIEYARTLAEEGEKNGMYVYGRILSESKNHMVKTDIKAASYYLRKSAEKGKIDAMLAYAEMLDKGEGVRVDKEKAQHYYKMASDSRHKAERKKKHKKRY